MKISQRILNLPHVESISDERKYGEGIFVYFKKGFVNPQMECGTVHEDTWYEVYSKAQDFEQLDREEEEAETVPPCKELCSLMQEAVERSNASGIVWNVYKTKQGTFELARPRAFINEELLFSTIDIVLEDQSK